LYKIFKPAVFPLIFAARELC